MKIFIAKSYPSAGFYYKVLRFLLSHATRKEIDFYLDELIKEKKYSKKRLTKAPFNVIIKTQRERS